MTARQIPGKLIAILGPTATGKSAMAAAIAKTFGMHILNCDSRQIYREMDIGTAKPAMLERSEIPHCLFDLVSPDQRFSAGKYALEAADCVRETWQAGRIPLLTGGTGFYFEALTEGLPEMECDEDLRNKLQKRLETHGLDSLVAELRRIDPTAAAGTDLKNPRRVLRALEIIYCSGDLLNAARKRSPLNCTEILAFSISMPREILKERIENRIDEMIDTGLENEVRTLLGKYGPDAPGLRTIGYYEWLDYFECRSSFDDLKAAISIDTRRYAKRQETWFKKRPKSIAVNAANPDSLNGMLRIIEDFLDI